jgi:tetratricopeptide (TPR) repeat protein
MNSSKNKSEQVPLSIGEKVRKARLEQRMTQEGLSEGLFSKSYVSAVELGKMQPSFKALQLLAERLNVPLAYFLDEVVESSQEHEVGLAFFRLNMLLSPYVDYCPGTVEQLICWLQQQCLTPFQQAELVMFEGRLAIITGQLARSLALFKKAENAWKELNLPENVSQALLWQGHTLITGQNWLPALEPLKTGLNLVKAQEIHSPQLRLEFYSLLITAYRNLKDFDEMDKLKAEAWGLSQQLSNPRNHSKVYIEISDLCRQRRDYKTAQHFLSIAQGIQNGMKIRAILRQLYYDYGKVYSQNSRFVEAIDSYQQVITHTMPIINEPTSVFACNELARMYLEYQMFDEALEVTKFAIDLVDKNHLHTEAGLVSITMGQVYEKMGKRDEADQLFTRGLEQLERSTRSADMADAYFAYGKVFVERGDNQKGINFFNQAYQVLRQRDALPNKA